MMREGGDIEVGGGGGEGSKNESRSAIVGPVKNTHLRNRIIIILTTPKTNKFHLFPHPPPLLWECFEVVCEKGVLSQKRVFVFLFAEPVPSKL